MDGNVAGAPPAQKSQGGMAEKQSSTGAPAKFSELLKNSSSKKYVAYNEDEYGDFEKAPPSENSKSSISVLSTWSSTLRVRICWEDSKSPLILIGSSEVGFGELGFGAVEVVDMSKLNECVASVVEIVKDLFSDSVDWKSSFPS